MKKYLLLFAILYGKFAFSQLNDTFVDGNFTSTPIWTGSNTSNDFTITSQQLRSSSTTANANFYLSTANTLSNSCEWEFWVNLQFNPSGANYVDVYLTSDQQNLQSANINGYFVRIGNTNDEISLYKRSGATSTITKLIDGTDGILNTSNNKARIKITRTAANLFTLERDITGLGTSYVTEGSFLDASFTTSAYFGIFVQQSTSGFHQKHFFDDFKIIVLNTDNTPPSVLSASAVDSTTLEIVFSEAVDSISAKTTSNYLLNNNYGNPLSVKTTSDESTYRLKFNHGLNTGTYLLTATDVKDKGGNSITDNNTASFSYVKPYIAAKGDLIINEIFADPSPQIDLPSVEFVEIYNTTSHTIHLSGWKYSDPGTSYTFTSDSIKAGKHLILCAKADTNEYKSYGKTIGISPWPSLNNSSDIIKLVSPEKLVVDSVSYSDTWYPAAKKSGGWSLERIDFNSNCSGIYNWTASPDITGGSPGRQNASYIPNLDLLNFRADSIKLSGNEIKIFFNKSADPSTTANAFVLNPTSGVVNASFDTHGKQATLSFSNPFTSSTSYSFNLSHLKDCAGNSVTASSFSFSTPKLPPVRVDTAKIHITEFFADPSPEVNLPLSEFVEIYNPGQDTIDLDGWSINDPTIKAIITKRRILPKEYLILCPIADTILYKPFGTTIGLSPWPSLNNASDQIALKSFTGRLVDSLAFTDSWHAQNKRAGGWTLERVDFASLCAGTYNWVSSINPNGGTPGKQNSAFIADYDKIPFTADSLKLLNDTTLTVFFNKAVNIANARGTYTLQPSVTIKSVSYGTDTKQATLTFKDIPLAGTSYNLSIKELNDCAGNEIIALPAKLQFTTPKASLLRVDTAKIYITEIFADPSPEIKLPLAEFVEIFNPGKDTINLDGWILESLKVKSQIKRASILPESYLILCPAADSIQYNTFGKVATISPWPALTNASDKISIKSFRGRTVDSISYSDTWHSTLTKKQGGWSLERIDINSSCKEPFNWSSSVDTTGGTPGRSNSIAFKNYDKLPFSANGVQQLSDTSILITFNKHADVSSSANAFSLTPQAGKLKKVNFDSQAQKATLIFANKFLPNTTYSCELNQLKDCSGNNILPTTLVFTAPKLPPLKVDTAKILITEIFADPSPEVGLPLGEFVEIFNPGKDTIDLEGWIISNSKTTSSIKKGKILPSELIILCSSTDSVAYSSFGKTISVTPWAALINGSDKITLKSAKNRLTDSVTYEDKWHSLAIKRQGGWSLERIDWKSACKNAFNWKSSVAISGGSPGKPNSVSQQDFDKLILRADSVKQLSDTTLRVYFNKPVDASTIASAFELKPFTSLKSMDLDYRAEQATLTCNQKLIPNTSYELAVTQLKDCAGNPSTQNILKFKTPRLPPARLDTAKLYITEIFADPSPEVGLPLGEFVEIFNPGRDTIDLEGWTLADGTSSATVKKAEILPQQYAIFCSTADTSQYKVFGKVIGISPWPSLNNTADLVTLKSFKGRTVDSIPYRSLWHKDIAKQDGGWTLERIDFASPCILSQNWDSSEHQSGGTPGKQNSIHQIYSSAEHLKILSARILDSVSILVRFNRPPDSVLSTNHHNYNINNGVGKPVSVSVGNSLSEVILKLSSVIARGHTYTVSAAGIADCAGSPLSASGSSAAFYHPHKIYKGDVLISEILFNPRSGGADFIELYNKSAHALNLKELSIALLGSADSIVQKKPISTDDLILEPGQYLVLSREPDNVKKEYYTEGLFLKTPSLPSFNNDQGAVVLLSNEIRIEEFRYSEKMHFPLIKEPKGVSLERSSFTRPANEPGNFRSAAASVGFATPGYKNSQSSADLTTEPDNVALLSKTFSPDNDGFEDVLQIGYHFKDAETMANVSIYNDKGILIRHLTKNTSLALEGTLIWDGIKDDGQRASVGIYIVYFDVFNLKGTTRKYKKACVLAAKF